MIRIRKKSRIFENKNDKMINRVANVAAEYELRQQAERLAEYLRQNNEGLRYARLLQEALFHDPQTLGMIFPESFIYHSSKDIIGGDFYWFEKFNNKAFIACADCTGHGVPGAMLTVLGVNKLTEIINSSEFPPSRILDKLNKIIYRALGKKYSEKKMKDGMDIALYSVDMDTNILNFSGANNPLCVVRKGELILMEADKQSIGSSLEAKVFTNKTIQLEKGDMLYVYTDGYSDQFGGDQGKKFTRARFKDLLKTIAEMDMTEQKNLIEKTLKNWMLGQEQTDDICIIGVRIS